MDRGRVAGKKILGSHAFLMAVCCLGIILAAIALYALGFWSYVLWLVLLACPLMHALMMKGGHGCGSHGHEAKSEKGGHVGHE